MMLSLLFTLCAGAATADPKTTQLGGVVENDAGQSVAGATVFIRTAGPRQGVGDL